MSLVRAATWTWKYSKPTSVRLFCSSTTHSSAGGNVLDTLASRLLLSQVTAPNSLRKHLQGSDQRCVYVGVDPSADSLHVGNLLPLLAALHFLQHGHRVVVVIGGATGSIGDPSGRDTERTALSSSELARNVDGITSQVNTFFQRATEYLERRSPVKLDKANKQKTDQTGTLERTPMQKAAAQFTNITETENASDQAMNASVSAPGSQSFSGIQVAEESSPISNVFVINNEAFYKNINVLSFLRDVGTLARVGTMLARDSVKSRLQLTSASSTTQSSTGLSFTEFSYQLLQAYDFSVLHGAPWYCTVQLGGSDQMGNIMAGVDLIRRQKSIQEKEQEEQDKDGDDIPAYGLTLPLLTTASGAKFGKSAGNAVWLSKEKCSDYDLYQFFYRSRDDEVELYLKTLTMVSLEMVDSIMRAHQEDPSARRAQKILASEVTELIRGKEAVKRAQAATRVLFETQLEGLQAKEVEDAFQNDSRLQRIERGHLY